MRIMRVLAAGAVAVSLSACIGPDYDGRYGYDDDGYGYYGYEHPRLGALRPGLYGGPVLGGLAAPRLDPPYREHGAHRRERPPQEGIDMPWSH